MGEDPIRFLVRIRLIRSLLHGRPLGLAFLIGLAVGVVAGGCVNVRPDPALSASPSPEKTGVFSHRLFDQVLSRYVDERGRVDYEGLARDPGDLFAYFAELSRFSPDSHPELFPDEASRLAYWLNAYNASALVIVLRHYPVASVRDVPRPPGLFFTPRLWGFFFFHRVTLGGRGTSLYTLEHFVIRKRFHDPRIHFALNCASASCPRLPQRAFRGDDLEDILQAEALEFVADPRNVRIEPENGRIRLSSIFEWYEDDFVDWPTRGGSDPIESLVDYVERHLDEDRVELLRACGACEIEFIEYDWTLNAQPPE